MIAYDELENLLSGLEGEYFTSKAGPIRFGPNKSTRPEPESYSAHYAFAEPGSSTFLRADWELASGRLWPAATLSGYGTSLDGMLGKLDLRIEDLDRAVQVMQRPMDGINGVAEHIIGLRASPSSPRKAYYRIEAPFRVRFESTKCRLRSGELHVGVHAGSLHEADHVSIGYVIAAGTQLLDSDSFIPRGEDWAQVGSELSIEYTKEVSEATSVTLLLRVGNQLIERLQLTDFHAGQNPRIASYSDADPDLRYLNQSLSPEERSNSSIFERAVARVFHLAGFQVDVLGPDKELSNNVDMHVHDPYSRTLFAVECTTGVINSAGKLSKLHMRVQDLTAALPGYDVRPVLVTAEARGNLSPASLQEAGRDGISVLACEDLEEVMAFAVREAATARAVDFLASRVPTLPREGGINGPALGALGALGRF